LWLSWRQLERVLDEALLLEVAIELGRAGEPLEVSDTGLDEGELLREEVGVGHDPADPTGVVRR
jgi:hypothetical protein